MSKIVSLRAYQDLKKAQDEDYAYQAQVLCMNKVQLLEEMIRFQQERAQLGSLNLKMIIKGRVLFKQLELHAESEALKLLSRSYRRHLDLEMSQYLNTKQ